MEKEKETMYYDYSHLDGYQCPCKIAVSRRGLGKTFSIKRRCVERFITRGEMFIYVVETGDMIKELAKDEGAKFWVALMEEYSKQDTSRKRYFFSKLTDLVIETDDEDTPPELRRNAKLIGGTIKIGGKTAGYIVDFNSFGELKRNDFNGVKTVFVDEFISEKLDKTTLEYPKRISSIIQSIGRLRYIRIYMAGNTVRLDDPILCRMGFKIEKYGFYKRYVRGKLFCVMHFVDPDDYPKFAKAYDESVAGQFAYMLGETNEEENKFVSDLPSNRKLVKFNYKKGGVHLNIVKDNTIVTLRERNDGTYACVPFSAGRASKLYCLTEKEQGYKMGYLVIWSQNLRQFILNLLRGDMIYYYTEIEYNQLKIIVQGGK